MFVSYIAQQQYLLHIVPYGILTGIKIEKKNGIQNRRNKNGKVNT